MSRRTYEYVEQDRRGNPQFVRPVRRNSTRNSSRMSTLDRLREAENQIDDLIEEKNHLSLSLSTAQAAVYDTENRFRSLLNEHNQCRGLRDELRIQDNEAHRLRSRLDEEKMKNDRLKAEVNRLTGPGNYRQRYEDKLREIATLEHQRDQRDDLILQRDAEVQQLEDLLRDRVARRDITINNMQQLLRGLGYDYREQ